MASATFAPTVPSLELPASWRARFRLHPTLGQLGRYAIVGGAGTSLNVVLFLVARPFLDAVPANVVAIVVSTVATTEANRRFTFSAEGGHRWRTLLQNAGTVVFYAFYGSAVLMLLGAIVGHPTELMESAAIVSASLLGGLARFAVMRRWEFAPARTALPGHSAHKAQRERRAAERSDRSMPRRSTEPRSVTTTSTSWDAVVTGRDSRSTSVEAPLWLLATATTDSPSCERVPPSA
jgi:putative flippase GtrA